ncbi:MAG: hypothetical protein ACP5J5_05595 [Dissulfurimicrobium sp.]|uniref:hypothetical protein n=1 Tax=Dissulfurimicrobium hydrothermale TaxID=1750598 RepID=UPI003C7914EB
MKKMWILSLILSVSILGCATTGVTPQKTQLQIREFQTRSYETNDTKMVMKAMLNVLQDDGFIVKNAVLDLGLLSAEKSVDIENKGEAFLAKFFEGANAVWKKASIIECTANVSEHGKQIRVRVNFQVKVLNNKGGIIKIEQIDDEKYYQDFFSKVDKGIFIQKEKI